MHMVYFTQRNTHTRTSVSKDKCLITFQTGTEENKMILILLWFKCYDLNLKWFKGLIKAMSIWADELSKQTEYMARLCVHVSLTSQGAWSKEDHIWGNCATII